MQSQKRWMIVAMIVHLSACSKEESRSESERPAAVEKIPNSEFNRVTLSPKAAERLGIATDQVHEVSVTRNRGEVVVMPPSQGGTASSVWLRVPLTESELKQVDPRQQARVLPLTGDNMGAELKAKPMEVRLPGDSENPELLYAMESAEGDLLPGQFVQVETPLLGSGEARRVIPYQSVVYGTSGQTWVYTNPEPLTFVRYSITIDHIEGDLAVLSDGPPAGTEIVTVGVAELYGTEYGVGR